jgi:hypothetical protein
VAFGQRTSARWRSASTGDHRGLIDGARRTGESERKLRRGTSGDVLSLVTA